MSSTGRKEARRPHDFYATPRWCVSRLLEAVQIPAGAWLEPCAGEGDIVSAVSKCRSDVIWDVFEVREECRQALYGLQEALSVRRVRIGDFLSANVPKEYVATLMNPPFTYAKEFIDRAKSCSDWVVSLERLNFMGGEERSAWMRADMPDVYILPNRPSFTGSGTDSIEYAWFVWGPDRGQRQGRIEVLPSTPIEERRRP
jgi:hypothetical protein